MTDISDTATAQEEHARAVALAAQQARAKLVGKSAADSATECEDCDDAIPQARREAVPGCTLCVGCQTQREKSFYER
ncbi:TraR/DksA family transcriptional regulator [Duganella sp. CY15W]|uniref:TraR/DksA C4-type zinc finger protein n=1 Tax=Duganella sp. CY15W TaxID=2692172 RepID=UPI00136BC72F|nr:TraR/DksA C4-type zinc finger protein [Duganella sp. CY15W]MYM32247.1 TraR/DksA family transcriptional regulator [Duganella sp. CY15W]